MVSIGPPRLPKTPKGGTRARRSFRPQVEALEDRSLLSATGYSVINLASDVPGLARFTDSNLVNPWGMSFSPTGPFWFADNGTGFSDVLDGRGVSIPLSATFAKRDGPTGAVFNAGEGFRVTANGQSAAAQFLFATEDGAIYGWSPVVNALAAVRVVDRSALDAFYSGLALATDASGHSFLYAADSANGTIDVFDENFHLVRTSGAFEDKSLPIDAVPFNIQRIDDRLFVTYAEKDKSTYEFLFGPGHGSVDEFDLSGNLIQSFASKGELNVPWGVALAPANFGEFGGALLVGNFGDGHVNAFNFQTGAFFGQLTDDQGAPIAVPGLWSLSFGNDHLGGSADDLFFTARIDFGDHGLFGAIQSPARRGADTAGPLPFDPTFPGERSDYPIPPTNGPALTPAAPAQLAPVLLPVATSSLVLAPTLTTTNVARGRDADPLNVPTFSIDNRATSSIVLASYVPIGSLVDGEVAIVAAPVTRAVAQPASFLDLAPAPTLVASETTVIRPAGNPEFAPIIVSPQIASLAGDVVAEISIETQTVALTPVISTDADVAPEPERRSWIGFAILFVGALGSLVVVRELHGRRVISLPKLRTARSA